MAQTIAKTIAYYAFITTNFLLAVFVFSPINLVYEYITIKQPNFFCKSPNTPEKHKKKVTKIQNQIRKWNEKGRPGLLCTSRPSWSKFTFRDVDKSSETFNQIDVNLGDIISIDEEKCILTVEPRMKMGTLTHKLLPLGWTIPIVPEFKDLTIGGLICGAGLETSSHKYGDFAKQCLAYEVVLSDGEVVNCSKTENFDLFESIPMSYGTLGFLTAVQIQLIRPKKYVQLQYYPATNSTDAMKLLQNPTHEFIEGIQFGPKKFVIVYGDFADSAPWAKTQRFLNGWNQHFHWNVEEFFNKPPGSVQFVPTRDYYHRHSNGYFWTFSIPFPFLRFWIFRFLFGWALPLNFYLVKLVSNIITCGKSSGGGFISWGLEFCNYFLQDYLIPISKAPEFLDIIHQDLGIYPIWLCPCRAVPSNGMLQPINNQETMYLDIGVYGYCFNLPMSITEIWRKYEKYMVDNSGGIGFYTDSYLTREEFEKMFSHKLYFEMRKKYNCDGAFPLAYDKVSLDARTNNKTKKEEKPSEFTDVKL